MSFDKLPDEIKLYRQWLVWRFEDRDSVKPTKVPYCAITGKLAATNKPNTWCTFEQACHVIKTSDTYDGIGFVLTEDDPFAFIDLDDTKGDEVAFNRQLDIFKQFDSFAEKSPSGKGLHIIVKAKLPSGRKRSCIEIYSSGRYMTMTGDVYRDGPIKDYNDLLNGLFAQMSKGKKSAQFYEGRIEADETDEIIIQRATDAANGGKFDDLYNGKWEDFYSSQSEADFALVNIIAFYSHNKEQICRIFRSSGLGQREKAKRADYMGWMLGRCFDNMLPPVDVDGLLNQLNDVIRQRQKREALLTKESKTKEVEQLTDVYSVPPGLVGEIAKFIYAQAPRPVPEIALAGALGMMSGIVGRSYNVSGTGLNHYTLLIAKSGYGKEAMPRGIGLLFKEVAKTTPCANEFLGPAEISSPQAIIKHMANGPTSFISQWGEFGLKLKEMHGKHASPAMEGVRRFLLMAYNKSGNADSFLPAIWADNAKNTKPISSPNISILGDSTPKRFYDELDEGLIIEGLLGRCIVIEYEGKRVPKNKDFNKVKPSFELIEKLSTLCAHSLSLNTHNKAIDVQFTPDAQIMFDAFDKSCDANHDATDREIIENLWTRADIKAMKLAALIAVGCNPYHPKITTEIGTWAINIIKSDIENLIKRFNAGDIGVDNDEMKQMNKVCKVVKKYVLSPWPKVAKQVGEKLSVLHSNKIIPYGYIQRNLVSDAVFRKDRITGTGAIKRAIQTLIERGDLEEVSRAKLSKDYKTTAKAYMISNHKAFDL